MRYLGVVLFLCVISLTANSHATIFGTVRGLVHDPQHRPVSGAPVTIRAENLDWNRSTRIRGWEASLRSPRLASRAQLHIAYSHQFVQGCGGVTGGLTDFASPESCALFFLDHDQRDTLSVGGQVALPWQSSASANIAYGSGFLDGNGPSHLPSHSAADLSLGKSIGERWSVQATTLNVTNHQHLVDNSNTFGGTHYAFPRQVSVQVQYKFKY